MHLGTETLQLQEQVVLEDDPHVVLLSVDAFHQVVVVDMFVAALHQILPPKFVQLGTETLHLHFL
jgi:hypothetical protein